MPSKYQLNRTENFNSGELLPIKNCFFRVVHVENGVLVLTLEGFTKRGLEIVSELRAEMQMRQREEMKEVTKDTR